MTAPPLKAAQSRGQSCEGAIWHRGVGDSRMPYCYRVWSAIAFVVVSHITSSKSSKKLVRTSFFRQIRPKDTIGAFSFPLSELLSDTRGLVLGQDAVLGHLVCPIILPSLQHLNECFLRIIDPSLAKAMQLVEVQKLQQLVSAICAFIWVPALLCWHIYVIIPRDLIFRPDLGFAGNLTLRGGDTET